MGKVWAKVGLKGGKAKRWKDSQINAGRQTVIDVKKILKCLFFFTFFFSD